MSRPLWAFEDPAEQSASDAALLERSQVSLADMIGYHNCEHAHLDRSCCVCESKLVLRAIEDRLSPKPARKP